MDDKRGPRVPLVNQWTSTKGTKGTTVVVLVVVGLSKTSVQTAT